MKENEGLPESKCRRRDWACANMREERRRWRMTDAEKGVWSIAEELKRERA